MNRKSMKVKTKGRFNLEFATNGKLFSIDQNWAKIANPEMQKVLANREQADLIMLQKKKEQKILSDKLWLETLAGQQ